LFSTFVLLPFDVCVCVNCEDVFSVTCVGVTSYEKGDSRQAKGIAHPQQRGLPSQSLKGVCQKGDGCLVDIMWQLLFNSGWLSHRGSL